MITASVMKGLRSIQKNCSKKITEFRKNITSNYSQKIEEALAYVLLFFQQLVPKFHNNREIEAQRSSIKI